MLLSEVLSAIESMNIYKKDYDIIVDLINYGDKELFTKILEEVLAGNLYWSDLETLLANTKYPEILKKSLSNQLEIQSEIKKFTALRQTLGKIEVDVSR